MPLGVAFLIWLAKNPEISQSLGLVSAKANLIAYSATDWETYLALSAEIVAAGGFFFFIMAIGWVFGREFVDGTLKDILAVPVPRWSILLAKFSVVAVWCVVISLINFIFSLIMGAIIQLPGGSLNVLLHGSAIFAFTTCLVIGNILPFAFFASIGRGYLLPIGVAVLTLVTANLLMVLGLAEYFPWAVPLLYAQGKSQLSPISYWIVFGTCLAGWVTTYLWWQLADQNR
jgi:ABC-2 type transport system permease protein